MWVRESDEFDDEVERWRRAALVLDTWLPRDILGLVAAYSHPARHEWPTSSARCL